MRSSVISKALSLKNAVVAAVAAAGLSALITVVTTQPVAAQEALQLPLAPEVDMKSFVLHVNPKFSACLGVAGQPAPTAKVTVTRGKLNDTLTINGTHFKPNLAFDMFTVERSNLLS